MRTGGAAVTRGGRGRPAGGQMLPPPALQLEKKAARGEPRLVWLEGWQGTGEGGSPLLQKTPGPKAGRQRR